MTSKFDIPKKMNAAFIGQDGNLVIKQIDIPIPSKGEVLIRIIASPINPSDFARIKNIDQSEIGSFIPGIEGCGIVVAAGKGILPRMILDKRVACFAKHQTSGTWAEYLLTTAASCFPVNKRISDDQASMTLVNPMTALAFIDYAKKENHKAIISTAAASALGKMISFLGKKYQIPVINIVRNENNVNILKRLGNKYILNSEQDQFKEKLKELATSLKATLYLDAIGGTFTSNILDYLQPNSTILLYGTLSKENLEIVPHNLIRDNHKVIGFYLGNWMTKHSLLKVIGNLRMVSTLVKNGMTTSVQAKFPLENINDAIYLYTNNMSKGKVLIQNKV